MPEQFPVFDVVLKKRGRAWRWCVSTTEGKLMMQGTEPHRRAAKYQASRALFLLLCAPHRPSQLNDRADRDTRTGSDGPYTELPR
jgi:hypothetical protein